MSSPLVEETEDLASNVLAAGLLVVHDTGGGGKDDLAERTGGEEQVDPVLDCNIRSYQVSAFACALTLDGLTQDMIKKQKEVDTHCRQRGR